MYNKIIVILIRQNTVNPPEFEQDPNKTEQGRLESEIEVLLIYLHSQKKDREIDQLKKKLEIINVILLSL